MFDNVLLNLLSLYSLHKWDQLPAEEKKFGEHIQPALAEEDDHDEEDIVCGNRSDPAVASAWY